MLPTHIQDQARALAEMTSKMRTSRKEVKAKRGDEIFEGTDYPREWSGFVGQSEGKEQLQVASASAKARGVRLEHTLLASGLHGIGKSTLATLLAYHAGVGLLQASGAIDWKKALELLRSCEDGDVLFIDEIHTMISGGKAKAEWLLPYMTEGRLYTPDGAVEVPDVTIVAATTDAGKLPETILSRFMVKPKLVGYTDDEATGIARSLAERMSITVPDDGYARIARAASSNPRDMRSILIACRDLQFAFPDVELDYAKAFRWAGFSDDGLSVLAREMLVLLANQPEQTASIDNIGAMLGEPGPLRHHEQQLLRRGFVRVTGRGRQLTPEGAQRALDAIDNEEV